MSEHIEAYVHLLHNRGWMGADLWAEDADPNDWVNRLHASIYDDEFWRLLGAACQRPEIDLSTRRLVISRVTEAILGGQS